MTVLTLAIGGMAFHYVETNMVATVGEILALTAAEVSDKLVKFLAERYGDVQVVARMFSTRPQDRAFHSVHLAHVKAAYPDYLWLGDLPPIPWTPG